jgi:hypothetical protein
VDVSYKATQLARYFSRIFAGVRDVARIERHTRRRMIHQLHQVERLLPRRHQGFFVQLYGQGESKALRLNRQSPHIRGDIASDTQPIVGGRFRPRLDRDGVRSEAMGQAKTGSRVLYGQLSTCGITQSTVSGVEGRNLKSEINKLFLKCVPLGIRGGEGIEVRAVRRHHHHVHEAKALPLNFGQRGIECVEPEPESRTTDFDHAVSLIFFLLKASG